MLGKIPMHEPINFNALFLTQINFNLFLCSWVFNDEIVEWKNYHRLSWFLNDTNTFFAQLFLIVFRYHWDALMCEDNFIQTLQVMLIDEVVT